MLTCLILTPAQRGVHCYSHFTDEPVRLYCSKVTQQLSFQVAAPTQIPLLLWGFFHGFIPASVPSCALLPAATWQHLSSGRPCLPPSPPHIEVCSCSPESRLRLTSQHIGRQRSNQFSPLLPLPESSWYEKVSRNCAPRQNAPKGTPGLRGTARGVAGAAGLGGVFTSVRAVACLPSLSLV